MALAARKATHDTLDDLSLAGLARAGDGDAFRTIMRRHNRRLYRVARGLLGDDAEAEDVVQESYLKAFRGLDGFRGESSLSTWLTRIAMNEAMGRVRRRRPQVDLDVLDLIGQGGDTSIVIFPGGRVDDNPEEGAGRAELRLLLERAIDELPEAFRIVFVLREVEQLSVKETAEELGIQAETVRTRLHRAKRLLRQSLEQQFGSTLADAYAFDGERCERLTRAVLLRLGV